MKRFSNNLAGAVRVMSILAPFTTAVATALWAVHGVAASHARETAHWAVATAVSAADDLPAKFAAAFVDQEDEPTFVRAIVAWPDGPLPQPQKTLAAFLSGDCCLGHPKVKLFASERSPNVSHQLLSHSLPESLQDISAIGIDQLYTTSTTAVSLASDKLTQVPIAEIS